MSFSLVDKNEKVTNTYKIFLCMSERWHKIHTRQHDTKYTIPMLREGIVTCLMYQSLYLLIVP